MGTIREREPGVWEVRVFVGRDPVTKRPRQVSRIVRAPRTKTGRPPKAATDMEHELEAQAARGKFARTGRATTVGQLLDRYLDHLEVQGLSPKTLHNYRRYVENTISPAIGSVPVSNLTALDLDNLYKAMTKRGRAPATVRLAHAVISGALGQAVKWGMIPVNVALMASPPKVRARPVVPPSLPEVRALLEEAHRRDPVLAALIGLAALTGARRGELCALRWTDVDLKTRTLRISRSLMDIPGRIEEKATKTHQERTVALGDAGVELLELHHQEVDARAAEGGVKIRRDAFLFSERLDGTTPVRPDKVTRFFTDLRDSLGLDHVHLHSLRHFVATQLAPLVSMRTLAGRLGHADASITMRVYAGWLPASDLEAADHIGRALSPGN